MISLENILQLIEIVVVIIGVVFALYQLRQYRHRQDRDAAMVLLHSLQTPEFSHGMALLFELPEGLTKEELKEHVGDNILYLNVLFATFESIGVLVYRNDLNLTLVHDFFSGPVILFWQKCGQYFEELRNETNQDTIGEWAQWLAERILDFDMKRTTLPAYTAYKDWTPPKK